MRLPVVIAGGGISGLSTAYFLSKSGIPSTIIEPRAHLGGIIQTRQIEGCTVELGPDSFLSAKPAARELMREVGLGGELIGSNEDKRGTYIWRDGRLRRMPDGMTMMVPGKMSAVLQSDLLSWPGKLRAGLDLFRRPPTGPVPDRSIAEFVTDHFGSEVLEYIAEPLLAGVYGGDPAAMSALSVTPKFVEWEKRYGSLTRAARAEVKPRTEPLFGTLKTGLQTFVDRLASLGQPQVIQGSVEKVETGWRVRVNGDWIEADDLVVACRPEAILPNLFPQIPYTSARVIAVGFARKDVGRQFNGFGFLVPRKERKAVAACTWVPNKFAHRAPDDIVLLRLFTDGSIADVRSEINEKLGIGAEPLFQVEAEWPKAMPQYEVGHEVKLQVIDEMLGDFPGLHLAGNAYRGVGIPDCIESAKKAAERVSERYRLRTT